MSAPPYMKLYWGDYLKATRHLTRDQHGAYFLLIGEAWRLGGALPDDDALLGAWALCAPREWGVMKPIVMAFFALRRGKWVHDRVREELAHYDDVSRKRKSAGQRGGSLKRGKDDGNKQAIATQLATEPEPEPEPEEIVIKPPRFPSRKAIEAFDRFWAAYPRKVSKVDARKAFDKAWRKLPPFDEEAIILGGLERAKSAWIDPQFIPYASKWLNGERWTDEPEPPKVENVSNFARWMAVNRPQEAVRR